MYVVFYPDNQKHVKNVNKFIQILRKKYKINASTTDNHDYASASDKAHYCLQKLEQAHYVFIICSPGLKPYFNNQQQPDLMLQQTADSGILNENFFHFNNKKFFN